MLCALGVPASKVSVSTFSLPAMVTTPPMLFTPPVTLASLSMRTRSSTMLRAPSPLCASLMLIKMDGLKSGFLTTTRVLLNYLRLTSLLQSFFSEIVEKIGEFVAQI